jgi:xyloglucan-specific exo-beta-1,4-glucanase
MKKRILLFAVFLSIIALSSAQQYKWSSLPVGGAGFVSGIITSAQQQNLIYARTDVGGAYRWDESFKGWIPMTDFISEANAGYMGVESIAIDPQSPNKIYMYVGTSYFSGGKSAILYSDNYGTTWTERKVVTTQFPAHGNDYGRQAGERLAIDPNKPVIMYCGSRTRGLWNSTDGGYNWVRSNSGTFIDNVKVAFVQFVPESGTPGNATQTMFLGLMRSGTTNLYVSYNNGVTWAAVPGQLTTYKPHRCLVSNGKLYITYSDSEGPGSSGSGAIQRYDITAQTWTDITPKNITNGSLIVSSYGEVTVDPTDPNKLMCSTQGMWWKQSWIAGADTYGDQVYLSENDGVTWRNLFPSSCTYSEPDVVWLQKSSQLHWAGSAKIDPFNRNRAFIISGNGIYVTENLWAAKPAWRMAVKGLEETVPQDMISLPNAPVVTVIGDYDGFIYPDITKYYARHSPSMGTTSGLAMAGKNTNMILRSSGSLLLSSNGGTSWATIPKQFAKFTSGKCALGASGGTIVWTPQDSITFYTFNNGVSWNAMPGITTENLRFRADNETDNVFYAINNGQFLTYIFNTTTSVFDYSSVALSNAVDRIAVVPGISGEVWVARRSSGLSRVSNATTGNPIIQNFTLNSVTCVGVGKAAPAKIYPSVYIWGKPLSTDAIGLYRSDDEGVSWTRINDANHQFGGPGNAQFVMGDMNVYGRVYMSTVGRGIIMGEIDSSNAVENFQNESNFSVDGTLFSYSLRVNSKGDSTYRIYSINGSLVENGSMRSSVYVGSNLPDGIYVLELVSDNEHSTLKIIKRN